MVVIASGPSLTEADVDHVRGKAAVIAVSDNYQIAPWADHLYAYDTTWWGYHKPIVAHCFRGRLWTGCERVKDIYPDITFVPTRRGDADVGDRYLVNGQNSGLQALCLAAYLKARRILLLGFDIQHTGGERHWFGRHPKGWGNADTAHKWVRHFDRIAPQFACRDVEVINCSRETALQCFPRATITEALP